MCLPCHSSASVSGALSVALETEKKILRKGPLVLLVFIALPSRLSWARGPSESAREENERVVLVEAEALDEPSAPEKTPSVEVLEGPALEVRSASGSAVDALRFSPGLDVVQAGGPAQITSVLIRGARSEDTLVLIDGIEANDVMSPARGYDFGALDALNIEKIEVYKGARASQFGPGAFGGAVNVVTKRGGTEPVGRLWSEAGSYDTLRGGASVRGDLVSLRGKPQTTARFPYSAAVSGLKTRGFSAADQSAGNGERDGAERVSVQASAGWAPRSTALVEGVLRRSDARADLDARGGIGGDDPNSQLRTQQLLTGLSARDRFFASRMASSVALSYGESVRKGSNPTDAARASSSDDEFIGQTLRAQTAHELSFGEGHSLRLGLDQREESGTGISTATTGGTPMALPFARREEQSFGAGLIYRFENERWTAEGGVRRDEHSRAGAMPSARGEIGRLLFDGGPRLRAAAAAAARAPSLFQLGSRFGNPGLETERVRSLEASIEQRIGERAKASIAWHRSRYERLIDYDLVVNRYANVRSAEVSGWEAQLETCLTRAWTFVAGSSLLDARDGDSGAKLFRRPDSVVAAEARYAADDWEMSLAWRRVGLRDDVEPTALSRTVLDAYDVLRATGSVQVARGTRASLRVENAFNKQYQEAAGYGAEGFAAYAGLAVDLR